MDKKEKENWLRHKNFMKKKSDIAIELRSKESQFYGLKREFVYAQEEILDKYKKAKDSKHPRDIGNIRENILRDFLDSSGILPQK